MSGPTASIPSGGAFGYTATSDLQLDPVTHDANVLVHLVSTIAGETPAATTARLNSILNTAPLFGSIKYVLLVGDFILNAPLIVYSNIDLDVYRASVSLASGTVDNLLRNYADTITPEPPALATTTTGGSLAAGTYAYRVAAILPAGDSPAGGENTIVVPAGTSTNTTTLTWQAVAGATGYKVYGRTRAGELFMATLGNVLTWTDTGSVTPSGSIPAGLRDSNIRIRGGTWDGTGNNASPATVGTIYGLKKVGLRLCHVDNLLVEGQTVQGVPKWAIAIADCTKFTVRDITGNAQPSDVVHLNGPVSDFLVSNIKGSSGDDAVACYTSDWATYANSSGDITDGRIEKVYVKTTNTTGANIRLAGSLNYKLRRLTVDGVYTTAGTWGVCVYDDPSLANYGTDIDELLISDIHTKLTTNTQVILLSCSAGKRITIRGVHMPLVQGAELTAVAINKQVSGASAASIDRLVIEGVTATAGVSGNLVTIGSSTFTTGGVVTELIVDKPQALLPAGVALVRVYGTVTDLSVSEARLTATGANLGGLVYLEATAIVSRVSFNGPRITQSRALIESLTGAAAMTVLIRGLVAKTPARIGIIGNTATILLDNTLADSVVSPWFHANGGTFRLLAGSVHRVGSQVAISRVAAEAVSVNGLQVPCDVSLLTPTAGDMANNTNAGLACGTGPVVSNGTLWKHIYTGTTT